MFRRRNLLDIFKKICYNYYRKLKEDIYMFTEKDILARLQSGEDAQSIANEMADMINKANKMYADELAKAEEAKRAEEQKKAIQEQKKADLQAILDEFTLWFAQYYGIEETLSADQVMEWADSIQDTLHLLGNLDKMIAVKPKVKVAKKSNNPDETLDAFLKQMGW
jgi:crotonobetainyl-CoA:carnitine CoA-transferase CaiB-like acyl-CoA transferase